MKFVPALVFFVLITGQSSGMTHVNLLDATVFNGDWDAIREQPEDICVCQYPGRLYVVTSLGSGRDEKNRMCYSVSVCEYYDCEFVDCDHWGSMTGCVIGEWTKYMPDFIMSERTWERQSDDEKAVIVNASNFKGVGKAGWEPYMGDPSVETTVQNHKHIWGDPKIVFDSACVINGTTYIPTIENIQIAENVWDSVDGIDRCDDWCPYFDNINITNRTTIEDGDLVAVVHVVLKWYYYQEDCHISGDDIVCYDRFKNTTETADFVVRAPMPKIIDSSMFNNISAEIMMYNNTFAPYTLIDVNVPENTTITTFTYRNAIARNFKMIGIVNNEASTVQYIDESMWKESPKQNTITHIDELCVIHEAPINFSELSITVSSPYETVNVTKYDVTMMNSKPGDYLNAKRLLMHVLPMCVLLWGIIVNVKRWAR